MNKPNEKICDCLYRALCTTREEYNKEKAKTKYRTLMEKTNKQLCTENRNRVIKLLETSKTILGNLNSERLYHDKGTFEDNHDRETNSSTLDTILRLDEDTFQPEIEEAKADTTDESEADNLDLENNELIVIKEVRDHRFRRNRLKLTIIIDPGNISIVEDERRITSVAKPKVIDYLKRLKRNHPRRLSNLIRRRTDLLSLLKE